MLSSLADLPGPAATEASLHGNTSRSAQCPWCEDGGEIWTQIVPWKAFRPSAPVCQLPLVSLTCIHARGSECEILRMGGEGALSFLCRTKATSTIVFIFYGMCAHARARLGVDSHAVHCPHHSAFIDWQHVYAYREIIMLLCLIVSFHMFPIHHHTMNIWCAVTWK